MRLVLFTIGFLTLAGLPASWSAPAQTAPAGEAAIAEAMRGKLLEFQRAKLPDLTPWQKAIFEQEVLAFPMRFIKDYRREAGGAMTVEIELEPLRQYLAFHGSTVAGNDRRMLAMAVIAPGCGRCADQAPAAKKVFKERLERRGFQLVWVTPEQVADGAGPEAANDPERFAALAKARGAVATARLDLRPAAPDSIDTAHADEAHFAVVASIGVHEPGRETRQEGKIEQLREGDPMDAALVRVLTDAFTGLGEKWLARGAVDGQAPPGSEVALQLSGIKDYHQFARVRMMLAAGLKDYGALEERKFSRGTVVFTLRTGKGVDELKGVLAGMTVGEPKLGEPTRLAVLDAVEPQGTRGDGGGDSGGKWIRMELR